ncbi:coiled-coil domain-containing protein 30 isoform X2 [Scleropages formosus]|uniref:coiled-coil domain-containing protein 30 isoform X2 n=1 Tax=Scleropages formosus TaxID=113540 RepID=UPI0010FA82C0|nr:coiled-coil domain-containing protein 30 isoform X2 [Scleropages formosus]
MMMERKETLEHHDLASVIEDGRTELHGSNLYRGNSPGPCLDHHFTDESFYCVGCLSQGCASKETELAEIDQRLQEDGLGPGASPVERQLHLWRLLQSSESSLQSTSQDLQALRMQQAAEMKEVENYMEHIRGLLEERELLMAEYEHENEQLHSELQQMKLQHDAQLKEVVEMLDQEGLAEISYSSPSEQVAYLLVERSTLLERLEATDRKLDTQSLTGHPREIPQEEGLDPIGNTVQGDVQQQKESEQPAKSSATKVQGEAMPEEHAERQRLERDLDEASRRLAMAHQEIRHLTDELDSARKTQAVHESELCEAAQQVELLQQEVDTLKERDVAELQKAKEHNERLDQEIRALRGRVRVLDSERKTLLEMIENTKGDSQHVTRIPLETLSPYLGQRENSDGSQAVSTTPETALTPRDPNLVHKRCLQQLEDKDCRVRELQRRLQKLQTEQEELVERNEELESLLGEAQNLGKAEREHHESEVEGLQRKIKHLEAKLVSQESLPKNGNVGKEICPEQLRSNGQVRLEVLEGRLVEEKEWRKQLELDLAKAQVAIKTDKEELLKGEKELKKLRLDVERMQDEAKSLNARFAQVKGEKETLEEKVSQLERAEDSLRRDLHLQTTACDRAQEELRASKGQASELSDRVGLLGSEVSGLQKECESLRAQLVVERGRVAELQAQEERRAQAERERLKLELRRLREEYQGSHPEESQAKPNSGTRGRSGPSPTPPVDNEGVGNLDSLHVEVSWLQNTLEEERLLARQNQLALQAQISEAQARAKSQDSLLQQKGEESKQLRQELQRVQGLFTSAEKELRYEREKNLDLKRHNALLDQEKIKLSAELKQAQSKVNQLEQSNQVQSTETERLRHRVRELELEATRCAQIQQAHDGLQEELNTERIRVIAADKKVLELQQQVKSLLHQLRLEETRAQEASRLEKDMREMSDTLSELRAKLQEDQLQRKLLEQREEELLQQLHSLQSKEGAASRSSLELGRRLKQLETRLEVLESERATAAEEVRLSQNTCLNLRQQVASSQQESERLHEELQQVSQQLDAQIRKYNEKQTHHKLKLRKAKQIYIKEMVLRDERNQKLENDLALATTLSEKERVFTRTFMAENEKLLLEKGELQRRLNEAEETGSSSSRLASAVQQRVNFLEEENRQLQDRTLLLSNHVGSLERALRNAQLACSMEDVKKKFPSESFLLTDSLLQTAHPSIGACDTLSIVDAFRRVKVAAEHSESSKCSLPAASAQSSEIGYLNLTSPVAPLAAQDLDGSMGLSSGEV